MKRMKKTLALLLALAMSFSLAVTSAFAAGELTVTVGTVSGAAGDTVEVPVAVSNNPGILSTKLAFSFDSDALELTGMTKGEAFADARLEANLEAGIAVLDNSTASAVVSGDVALLTLIFKIKNGTVADTYTVSVDVKQVVGESLNTIAAVAEVGSVTVTEAAADLPSVDKDVDTSKMPETLPAENISFEKSEDDKTIMTINPVSTKADETVTAPACVVLIKNGETYTKVTANANADGTYSFDVSALGGGEIVIAVKGDTNQDGAFAADDASDILRDVASGGKLLGEQGRLTVDSVTADTAADLLRTIASGEDLAW